jgi:hypothetical protein
VAADLVLVCVLVVAALVTMFVLAACRVSGNIEAAERRIEALKAMGWAEWPASANGDYLAGSGWLDGSDVLDGSESDDG